MTETTRRRNTPTLPAPASPQPDQSDAFPDAASLAALRAWHEGLAARDAVERYLGAHVAPGTSARGVIGRLRRRLAALARRSHRADLAAPFECAAAERVAQARDAARAIEVLRTLPPLRPLLGDDVERWLAPRTCAALRGAGIGTLAALAVRLRLRRRWWTAVPGLGAAGARGIESFFAAHAQLAAPPQMLPVVAADDAVVPWERLRPPGDLDGSRGSFRAPAAACTLAATDDYAAVQAWLSLHEASATQRAYRKEAERLMLWAIVERGRALSSLTAEDAVAYRAFLRRPSPAARWTGPPRPRGAADWRPFAGGLSARSVAYALSVLGALFRWLVEQRYLVANPFAGLKVRGGARAAPLDASRVFGEGEWALLRAVADGLEASAGWRPAAAERLRFVLDFSYATGLRASELVGARLGDVEADGAAGGWLHLVGKGAKAGKVTLPPLARAALDRYLARRGFSAQAGRRDPQAPLVGSLGGDGAAGIGATRLWHVVRRFFLHAAKVVEPHGAPTADKLRRASPHWMRHTHATHALARGAGLTAVRDNLRHASISTTSVYLHADDIERARQLAGAFGTPPG